MKALILSCGTGGGHDAAGRAIAEELTERGHTAVMMNPYTLKSRKCALRINRIYVKTVQKAPRVFGAVYRLGNAYRRLPFRSPVYFANAGMCERLEKLIEAEKPDVIFMPHLYPAEIITNMKNRGVKPPLSVFIATDYTCIPFTEETDCDAYVIPSEKLIGEFSGWNIPSEKLYPLGIPVSAAFSKERDRESAVKRLGLDSQKRYILISGGSMGAGKLILAIKLLYDRFKNDESTRLIVICGSNEWLYKQLKSRYSHNIKAVMFTDKMADYIAASDVYVTKPGGLSSTEAAVSGVPMVHIMSIPGCETENMRFFEENGMCIAVRKLGKRLPDAVEKLRGGEEALKINRQMKININSNAAADICDLAAEILSRRVKGD